MVATPSTTTLRQQRGSSLIEVLVTIVIVAFGLLGLAGLLSRLQSSEMEAYQRSQALLLLNDMANRIASNRINHTSYLDEATTAIPLGTGIDCSVVGVATPNPVAKSDLREWCEALLGAGETETIGGEKVGAMIGGRGCIEDISIPAVINSPPTPSVPAVTAYRVTVAWQGLTPISAPPGSVACGAGSYNSTGTACINDLCRRTVTTVVRIAKLS